MKEMDYTFDQCEVYCDKCGYFKVIDSFDYSLVNKELKEEDWIVKKIGSRWYDFCDNECYREFLEKQKGE